jgi:hypothetical protein
VVDHTRRHHESDPPSRRVDPGVLKNCWLVSVFVDYLQQSIIALMMS